MNSLVIIDILLKEKINSIKDIFSFRLFIEKEFNMIDTDKVSINKIAKEANCSWNTAYKHYHGLHKGYSKKRSSKVDSSATIIQNILDDENVVIKSKMGFYKYLKREHPEITTYSYNTFKYHINKHFKNEFKKAKNRDFSTPFETEPGMQAQFDFKENYTVILNDGTRIKIDVAVIQLGYSRLVYRKVIPNKKTMTVTNFMLEAFEFFGGVPHEIVVDNAKCLVLSHNVETKTVVLNPLFEEFAKEMGFNVYACKPRRAKTKGKVERTMPLVEELGMYNGKADSHLFIGEKLELITDEYNDTSHSTTKFKPKFLASKEKEHLLPLPKVSICSRFKLNYTFSQKVSSTGVIKYNVTKYSVPYQLCSKQVDINVLEDCIHIYYNKFLVAIHKITNELLSIQQSHVHESVWRNKSLDTSNAPLHKCNNEIDEAALMNIAKLGGANNE